jgi:uncharacterized Zn-binding protein involved in type VI secretion
MYHLLGRGIVAIVFRARGAGTRRTIALVGDNHQCPGHSNHGPHVGGPITTGSSFLTIHGQSVARIGDQLTCQHAQDHITSGVLSITIEGKPIATAGDTTAHGGVIGNNTSNVFIEGSDE